MEQTLRTVALRDLDGQALALFRVRTAGHTHTGVASCVLTEEGRELVLKDASWDCREWQWWKGHGHGDQMRPRLAPAAPGYQDLPDGACVTSQYRCDGVITHQEWLIRHQPRSDAITYDCRHVITNDRDTDLVEYGQFFACYTEANRGESQFYWAQDGSFRSFASLGGVHLDRYIVAPESTFASRGAIPHAPRGNGRVADTWCHPVLIGLPTPGGWRHVVFVEPATTAGLASGMGGIAMDYIVYPGAAAFRRGDTFSARVRHHLVRMPDQIDGAVIEGLWANFERHAAAEQIPAPVRVDDAG